MNKIILLLLLAFTSTTQPLSQTKSRFAFCLQHLQKPFEVGSITPSSNATGRAMSSYIAQHIGTPKHILEIGAGPGSGITDDVINNLRPTDTFTIIEINPAFCTILHDKYGHIPNVSIVQADILEFAPDSKYDYIISSLPLTIFPKSFISSYFSNLRKLIKPCGIVSYIQYIGFPRLRMLIDALFRKTALKEKMQLIDAFKNKWHLESKRVLLNCPPTWVHHLQMA